MKHDENVDWMVILFSDFTWRGAGLQRGMGLAMTSKYLIRMAKHMTYSTTFESSWIGHLGFETARFIITINFYDSCE